MKPLAIQRRQTAMETGVEKVSQIAPWGKKLVGRNPSIRERAKIR
jgi:hypothetical protein